MASLRSILLRCFVVVGLGISACGYAADKVLDVGASGQAPVSLTEHFAVLEDPGLRLTVADVQTPEVATQFQTRLPAVEAYNFGYTKSALWLRLALRNDSDQPVTRMLELNYARYANVQFHQADAAGSVHSVETGIVLPYATRPYKNRFFVFPVSLPPHSEQQVYLRLQSSTPLLVPARLWQPQAFHEYERNDYLVQAWYFGMATAMVIFNLLLFLALRDTVYLLYINFVICIAFTFAALGGLTKEFLWLDAPLWSDISSYIGISLTQATLLLFMRRMLHTDEVIPQFDRLLKALIAVLLVSPLGFVLSYQTFAQAAVAFYGAMGVLILGTGLYCAFKRQRSAYFFVVAFAMPLVGGVLFALRGLGLAPTNALTVHGFQFGSAAEMLLLAFALADRYNQMRQEKAKVQRELLQAEQHLVESLKSSELVLEERVRQRTAELDEKNTALNNAIRSREDVERIARHDLKTPLGSIAAAASMLRGRQSVGESDAADQYDLLGIIEGAANHAISMVNLSLDLYRMENGTYVFRPQDVDLTAVVDAVILDTRAHARSKAVELQFSADSGHVMVKAEEAKCYAIIANLVKNAVEAAPDDSTVDVLIEDGARPRLRIHNQGSVPLSLRARFFAKYATEGKVGGTGLGTYSANLMTRAQNGTLMMETADETGTTLTLELERSSAQAPALADMTMPVAIANTASVIRPLRVLVVDDNKINHLIMGRFLAQSLAEVEIIVNGRLALESVMEQRPDIIFMDIEMPVMGGIEAMLRIREFQASCSQPPSMIVAFSANDDEDSHRMYMGLGFDQCLSKPSKLNEVLNLLKSIAG
jgi:signal transduction histidine kinase